jgi:hypothetical protein
VATPLIVCLLLDAQDEVGRAADTVPEAGRDAAPPTRNSAAWVLNHVGLYLDEGINVRLARGASVADWSRELAFVEARAALDQTIDASFDYLTGLTDDDLHAVVEGVGQRPLMPPSTVGVVIAAGAAHTFVHAGELVSIAIACGAEEMGLPGGMDHVRGKLVLPEDIGRLIRLQFYDDDVTTEDAVVLRRETVVIREITGVVQQVHSHEIVVHRDDDPDVRVRQNRVRFARFQDAPRAPMMSRGGAAAELGSRS